ncbi:MAG: RnfABCDGE type electron transport complex subunit C, partial [Oscillospiraceae bacterium]|nr:RnfABCDGE type electron transport complex subunit C [Oscillospiraceae bacterium]
MPRLHGVQLPHAKQTAASAFVQLPVPEKVLLPMSMHMGIPCTPTVKLRQQVLVGECIGTSEAPFSADVHASVSGTVTAIRDYRPANGSFCKAVEITTDGQQTVCPDVKVPVYTDRQSFLAALRRSGAVGMGGAGLPTHIKLNPKQKIDYLLVNAAECEPYITADDRIMQEKPLTILAGIRRIMDVLDIPACKIGVEKNKPHALKLLRKAAKKDNVITLVPLPAVYPQGAEKVLIYHTTGRIVPEGKLPADIGVIVMNVSSIAFLEEYFTTGMPLVSRGVTVDGSLVKQPCSLI